MSRFDGFIKRSELTRTPRGDTLKPIMMTEFVSVQLSRDELKELHGALVQRAMLEDELRREHGQEAIERRPLLERVEMLLGESEEMLHELDHALDDEMWEYAWYVFTDEWAHFRAKRDTARETGEMSKTDPTAFEKAVELRYQKQFDVYVNELEMDDGKKKKAIRSPQDTPGSRS